MHVNDVDSSSNCCYRSTNKFSRLFIHT